MNKEDVMAVRRKRPENTDDAYIITERNFLEALPLLIPQLMNDEDCEFKVKRKTKHGEVPCFFEVTVYNRYGAKESTENPQVFRVGHDIVWVRSPECSNPNGMFYLPKGEFERQYDVIEK